MSFERLLKPKSIAVFGGFQAQEVIRQSDLLGYTGEIWPVHPKKNEIMGRKVYRSVSELPDNPDAAYIGVNRYLTIEIVKELSARGAGGAICYATGFTEAGDEGSELEKQLLDVSGDMPLIGPNCYGLLNYLNGAALWPDQQGGQRVEKGVAIITMSSNVGFNLTMQRRGVPIAYMMSLGNRLKFDLHDAIHIFAQQDGVTAIGLYLETMPDPKAFESGVNLARKLGKPVVAIKTGRSDVAKKMVVSHTASLAGSDVLINALFDRLGVARVDSLEALMEALKVLHVLGPLGGGNIGAMSTSGGDLTLLADAMGSGLNMPPLSEKVTTELDQVLHKRMIAANPFDFQMFDWNDAEQMAINFTAFLSQKFDVSLCLLDYPREDICDQSTWDGAEKGFIKAAHTTNTKAAILSTYSDTISEPVAKRVMKENVAMLAGIDAGLAGVQAAVDIGVAWKKSVSMPLLGKADSIQESKVTVLDEAESKNLLSQNGVPVPDSKIVHNAEQAVAASETLGYPVVVKALGVAHKTEVGGVKINLGNAEEVSKAVKGMTDFSQAYLIEKMVEDVIAELIVGVARDDQFGPYLLVGGGGILVELMKDTKSLFLPTQKGEVLTALNQLKSSVLFSGFRGSPHADLNAAADAILIIAKLVETNTDPIVELDINPLMVLAKGKGVVAADALISLST
ncbi:acetate--CoA ligase family protein [Desulfobacterales bacterium HSG17]|nr:acetate--CoA ligase family protein [Desulfobacterales bacterium HSG17]